MARVWTALTKTTRILGWIALTAAAGAGLLTALTFGAVHTGKLAAFYVTSHSMAPAINAGDLILSAPTSAADIQIGDIITVPQETEDEGAVAYVTHRVVDIAPGTSSQERTITLQGDGNTSPDPVPFTRDEVLTHQVTIPGGADLLHFLRTPPTPYFIILLVIAGLGFTFLPTQPEPRHRAQDTTDPAGTPNDLTTPSRPADELVTISAAAPTANVPAATPGEAH